MNIIQSALANMHGVVSFSAALEAHALKSQEEDEVTIYAKIMNPEGLAQASYIEQHEQAEVKTKAGKIRIRKTTQNGRLPTYELTTKTPVASQGTFKNIETTKKINEEIYNMFMSVCSDFMSKTRYVFKAEQLRIKRGDMDATIKTNELKYEVDVFTKADGSISQWCKIDLEVDKIAEILTANNVTVQNLKLVASISGLPFEPDYVAIDNRDNDDPDRKAFITALYQKEFLIPRKIAKVS